MTKNFSKYSKIIESFRGEVLLDSFESKFTLATQHLPKPERFLLKMELKRLAQPCTRLIDLRGLVDGECIPFEYEDKPHYLDSVAIKVFEQNVAYYNGYTFGVYEAVKNTENNFRVIYQREKVNKAKEALLAPEENSKQVEKIQYPAKHYTFGPYYNRIEERMNFAIRVDVILSNTKTVACTSSDISVNGCKLRILQSVKLNVGELLNIKFTGLEQEFKFNDTKGYSYEVRNVQTVDDGVLVGLKRVYPGESIKDGFRRFLVGFIQGNKRRYKINLDNTVDALQSRILEQYLLPKINELPVVFIRENSKVLPRYALTGHDNHHIFEYWQNEKKQSLLYCLYTPERIERLLKSNKKAQSLLVYSFIHVNNGQRYCYTIDENQLADIPEFKAAVLGFSASKPTFAITQISIVDVEASNAFSPFTLSESIEKKNAYLNQEFSAEVNDIIDTVSFIGVATDITNEDIHNEYKTLNFEGIEAEILKPYGHKRLSISLPVDNLGITYNNHRKEPRFHYSTPVLIDAKKVSWQGTSVDFSISGVKVELEKSAVLMTGDIVYLTFPELQKITSAFELVKLPYEVIRVNKAKTIINLRIHVQKHQHIGRSFFKQLIERNKDKLSANEYALMTPGLAESLRNIYGSAMRSSSIAIQTSGSRYKYETLTTSDLNSPFLAVMKQLCTTPCEFNLYPLLKNNIRSEIIDRTLKKLQASDKPYTELLYISIIPNEKSLEDAIVTKTSGDLASPELKQKFIQNALNTGMFFCIEIKLFRVASPDLNVLNPELSYISSYAIHRGKQLEQDIYSVVGMIQFNDITKEALIRSALTSTN